MKIGYQSGKKYGLFSLLFLFHLIIQEAKPLPCWQFNSNALTTNQTRIELVLNHKFTNLQEFIFNKYFPVSLSCGNFTLQDSAYHSSFFDHYLKLVEVKFLKTKPIITSSRRIGLIHKCFILHQSSNEDPHLFC